MQSNRSKGTKIEVRLAKELWHRGLRYRKNDRTLPGTPDISFKGRRLAIFCDGEFWHGKDWEQAKYHIKSRRDYWWPKIERNRERDKEVDARLLEMGWTVLRFWEGDLNKNLCQCADKVETAWRESEQHKIHRTYLFDTRFDAAAENAFLYGQEEE